MSGYGEIIEGVNESIRQLKPAAKSLASVHETHTAALESGPTIKTAIETAADGLKTFIDNVVWSSRNSNAVGGFGGFSEKALDALKGIGMEATDNPHGQAMLAHVQYVKDSSSRYNEAAHMASELVTENDVVYLKDLAERLGQSMWWHKQEKELPEELVKATAHDVLEGVAYIASQQQNPQG